MASTATHRISKLNLPGDHSAKEDAAERRRIQNRINQRASRARKALKSGKNASKHPDRWVIYTAKNPVEPAMTPARLTPPATPQGSPEGTSPSASADNYQETHEFDVVSEWYNRKYDLMKGLEIQVASAAARSLGSIHLLAPVTHYNIISAMMNNAGIMGLTFNELEADIASQFNIDGPIEMNLPPSLQPSDSQRAIIHHPWIDLVPIQSFRDVLLKNMDKYDEDEFCGDLHGQIGASDGLGLIAWGESWDPNAYELAEPMFRKWYWILKDCPEILRTTNYWRRSRGEKPLCFEQPAGFVHPEEVEE